MKRHLLAAALATLGAAAGAADGPEFKFSGYGTLGVVKTDTDEAQFIQSGRQNKGADRSADLGVDSRLGVQANLNVNEVFSAVGQLFASRRDGSDAPVVEWLYAQARPASWLDVRAGRLVLPLFLVSDSRNVGYAAHWLRAPIEVYGTFPVSAFDGAQAQARAEWGGTNFSMQVSAGKAKAKIFGTFNLDMKFTDIRSLNVVAERGDWTARWGRTENGIEISGFPFPFPPDKDVFTGIGLQFDNGKWLAMSEYVTRDQASGGGDSKAYYVSGGYRIDAFTPYVTVSRFVPQGTLFPSLKDGRTQALGLRWDGLKQVALKAQIESTTRSLQFTRESPAFAATAPKVKVFSLAADFVF